MRGGEFRVNTTTANSQRLSTVAMDADGDFVVTWQSNGQDGSGLGIYAQRYNAAGGTVGTEFVVNTFRANDQKFSTVAMDADGDFVVTWTSDVVDGSDTGVSAQRFQWDRAVQLTSGMLAVVGTPLADVITVTQGANLVVTLNGETYTYPSESVFAISIESLGQNDSITIASLAVGTTLRADGGSGNDILAVNSTVNTAIVLVGGAGNDTLTGGGGGDTLIGGLGHDVYQFLNAAANQADVVVELAGGGTDTLDCATATVAVTANLLSDNSLVTMTNRTVVTGAAGQAAQVENVIGGTGGDTLTGNALANSLSGGAGNDTLTGGAGNDVYQFDGDLLLGSDTINEAGGGIDTLDFSGTTTRAVAVNLSNAAAQVVNAGLTLTLSATDTVENVIGGTFGDTLTGNTLANVLTGGAGNDTLSGGDGKNILIGGTGTDTLTGGTSEDLMLGARYTSEADSAALLALLNEWTSASSYDDRVAHLLGTLAGGLNGTFILDPTTVQEDAAPDTLTGGSGKDWYLRNSQGATVADRDTISDADIDSVFTEIANFL